MSTRREILKQAIDLVKHLNLRADEKCNLSPIQLRTLSYVKKGECVKPTQIAKEFNITPATVTAQIDKLVKKGWINRTSCKNDRRVVNITLTPKAEKELDRAIDKTLEKYDWIFEALSKEEEQQLLNLFIKIHENAHSRKEK